MKRKSAVIFWLAVFLFMNFAHAKRSVPPDVKPVFYKKTWNVPESLTLEIAFYAPHEKMGVVTARDPKDNHILWEQKIYQISYNPFLEKDVQDVFITNLEIKGDSLVVTNEKKERYKLNILSKEVPPKVLKVK